MPRYCAVKVCRNRGGTASQKENKRISFYPFPLQDRTRLQKWVDNMRREEWTPSRHQSLCSDHFTDDCFDIRWGIRYLKTTAIPTIFPPGQDEGEKKGLASQRNGKPKLLTGDTNTELIRAPPPTHRKPIILTRTVQPAHLASATTGDSPALETTGDTQPHALHLLVTADAEASLGRAPLSDTQPAVNGGTLAQSDLGPSTGGEPPAGGRTDSTVITSESDVLGAFCEGVTVADVTAGQTFSIVPLELVVGEVADGVWEDGGTSGEGECPSLCDHSYCRPDTDKEQLWSRILSLQAKIVQLDRREESTLAKIHALEAEILHLKRDGAVFKEKQKAYEDFLTSALT